MKPMGGLLKMRLDTDMPGRSKGDDIKPPKRKKGRVKKVDPFDSFDVKTVKRLKGAI